MSATFTGCDTTAVAGSGAAAAVPVMRSSRPERLALPESAVRGHNRFGADAVARVWVDCEVWLEADIAAATGAAKKIGV